MAKAEAPAVAAATEPLTLVVSLDEQKIDVYRGTVLRHERQGLERDAWP